MTLEESPVGESKSNGDIENAIKQVQGHFRTIKNYVERTLGITVKRETAH